MIMKLLKFHAAWCQPCKQLSTVLGQIRLPFPVVDIDIDDNMDAAIEFGIKSVPSMILLDENDNIIQKITGIRSKLQLEELFQPYLGNAE